MSMPWITKAKSPAMDVAWSWFEPSTSMGRGWERGAVGRIAAEPAIDAGVVAEQRAAITGNQWRDDRFMGQI